MPDLLNSAGCLSIAVDYWRSTKMTENKAHEPMPQQESPGANPSEPEGNTRAEISSDPADSGRKGEVPAFASLEKRHWVLSDLFRVLLIVLSIAVLGALILAFLPQSTIDGMVQKLQARHSAANPEQIEFLYLSDESSDNEFRVRGLIRNIAAMPLEKLDAVVRFYAHDRRLLETTVVRMSKDTIDPGALAQFELVYPNYGSEFGSYSVEFKLRQGSLVPYKDMRAAPPRTE